MITIFKNKPISQDNTVYKALLYILAIAATVPMLMPVIVGFESQFTRVELSTAYYIFRGLAAVILIVAVNVFAINRNITFFSVAGLLTSITTVFPLINSIDSLSKQVSFINKYNMKSDLSLFVFMVITYSLFLILGILTTLYSLGIFRFSVAIMVTSLCCTTLAQYYVIISNVRLEMNLYEILSFAYAVPLSLIPLVLSLSCKVPKKDSTPKENKGKRAKRQKYVAKRYANENS